MEPQQQTGGYGKRPLWQWIVIYLVIGAIVYFAVYKLFLAKRYTTPTNSTATQSSQFGY